LTTPVLRAPGGFLVFYSLPPAAIALGRRSITLVSGVAEQLAERPALFIAERLAPGFPDLALGVSSRLHKRQPRPCDTCYPIEIADRICGSA